MSLSLSENRPHFSGTGSSAGGPGMKELLRTNDLVKMSWVEALLADAGIGALMLDQHTSVLEGSTGAIPRRLMVLDEDYDRACRILREAGDAAEIR